MPALGYNARLGDSHWPATYPFMKLLVASDVT